MDAGSRQGDATLKQLAATIKAHWNCEQAYRQIKEELGFDTSMSTRGPGFIDMR